MGDPPARRQLPLVRILVVVAGVCAIAWSISAIRIYRAEPAFANSASAILAGDRFSPEQLKMLTQQVEAAPVGSLRSAALNDIAIIWLQLTEAAVQSSDAPLAVSALDKLQVAVAAAIQASPTSSFMWLTDYWARSVRSGNKADGLKSLGMSYALGENEGWIALRRNPLALSAFTSLPDKLAEQVLTEFTGLVRSGFYEQAANILAGSGESVRDKLLNRLVQVDDDDRRRFAKALASKGLDDIVVPGVEMHSSGPF
jgi:hypothetical protein